MQRNSGDERLRELERRVIAGDLGAVLQLHQERKRAGQERPFYSGTSYLAPVPGQGEILVEPQDERTILVKFGSREGVGHGQEYNRQKVDIPPIIVRNVPFYGFGHFGWYEGEGFVPLGPVTSKTYREDWMRSIERLDRGFPRPAPTSTQRAAVIQVLTPVVNAWAAAHRREMLEAEIGKANNAVTSADSDVAKAIDALEEAQKKLAATLLHEIGAQDALKSVGDQPSTGRSNPALESVVFYHGTPRKKLSSILKKGIEPSAGWGGAGTFGVYLAGTPQGALYWAKIAHQASNGEKMEASRFDRKYGDRVAEILAIVSVTVPSEAVANLRADMEQAEDVGFDGEETDWEASLEEIGDVMYDGHVPAEWVREVELPAERADGTGE